MLGVGTQRQAMRRNMRKHQLHVFRNRMGAPVQQGMRACRGNDGQPRARGKADADFGVLAAGFKQSLHIVDQGFAGEYVADGVAQFHDLLGGQPMYPFSRCDRHRRRDGGQPSRG